MMTNEVATVGSDLIERVVAGGDLSLLTPAQRTAYYVAVAREPGAESADTALRVHQVTRVD